MISSRIEVQRFIDRWSRLSEDARAAINMAVRHEWGEDLDVGEMLSRATFGWDGYDAHSLRAEALRPLIAWREAQGQPVTAWRGEAKNSDFTNYVLEVMQDHKDARRWATASSVETMMRHLGR